MSCHYWVRRNNGPCLPISLIINGYTLIIQLYRIEFCVSLEGRLCFQLCALTWLSSVWSVWTSLSRRSDGAAAEGAPCALAAVSCCTSASTMIMLDLNLCSSSCLGTHSRLPGGTLRAHVQNISWTQLQTRRPVKHPTEVSPTSTAVGPSECRSLPQ